MTNFQRKAEPVQAWQITGRHIPSWVFEAALQGSIKQGPPATHKGWLNRGLVVDSGEETALRLTVLDWIVLTADGSLLGVTKGDFARRYEALGDMADTPE